MRVTVLGAGGVGGYFGAKLAQGGAEVTLVARGAHGAAIAERGLLVRSPLGDFSVRPRVVATLAEAPLADVLMIAVKTTDLDAPIAPLADAGLRAQLLGDEGALLTVQNGLDADEVVAAVLGEPRRVIGGVGIIGAGIAESGVIEHRSRGILLVGAGEAGDPARAERLAADCSALGAMVTFVPTLRQVRWTKLLWNNAFNSISALTRRMVGEIMDDSRLLALVKRMMAEVEAVARAEGVQLPPDVIDQVLAFPPEVRNIRTSMLQDIERGRPLEQDALVGSVLRRARKHGVPTPVNDTMDALLAARPRSE